MTNYTGTDFLHLCADYRIEVNPIDIKLLYHCQFSTLSLEQIHPFQDGNGRVEYNALLDYFRIKH